MTSTTSENIRKKNLFYSARELKEMIVLIRYCLYNHNTLCGSKAIHDSCAAWASARCLRSRLSQEPYALTA